MATSTTVKGRPCSIKRRCVSGNINNSGQVKKERPLTDERNMKKAYAENSSLKEDNQKLKNRLRHVREQTFSECTKILDAIMAYCDQKAKDTGRRQHVIGEGKGNRVGAGCCASGLGGGYTPSGWNKLRTLGAMEGQKDVFAETDASRPEARGAGTDAAAGENPCKFRPSVRLLGEMAFQLERRILDYVFGVEGAKKRRFYGYTVSNICYMMEKESTAPDGMSDAVGRTEMTCRLRKILCALEKYGYDIKLHADFAQEVINKYGLLPCPPDEKTITAFGLHDACTIACLISRLTKRQSEVHNLNILLNCLNFISKCDGRPLFVW